MATSILVVGAIPTTAWAADAPLRATTVITWNMQGEEAGQRSGGRWQTTVRRLVRQAPIVLLQEVGAGIPSSMTDPNTSHPLPYVDHRTRDGDSVRNSVWNPEPERAGSGPYEVYFLQTDTNGGAHQGGRVNIAVITHAVPDEVRVVNNPVQAGRRALGVRFGHDWYFTFHGLSGGGGDSAVMLNRVDTMVSQWAQQDGVAGGYHWTVGGDFNVDPATLGNRADFPPARIYRTGLATQQSGGELDYAVSDDIVNNLPVFRLAGAGSDHYPVQIGGLRAAAEPVDIKGMPLGDSITYGYNSSTGDGYRGVFWDDIRLSSVMKRSQDFVGTRRSGRMADPDHEGHPGWRIDQIAEIADCSVPAHRPNVITLHAGTNDLNQNYQVDTAPARLGQLIDQILLDAPETTVLVATLVPSKKPEVQPRIVEFNRQVRALVAQRRDSGEHVLLADTSAVTTADLADQLHPNDNGYRKIAAAFLTGLYQAADNGWLRDPVGTGSPGGATCTPGTQEPGGWTNAGEVITESGVPAADGWTQLADVDGDGRDDRLTISDNGTVDAWLNKPGVGGKPSWSGLGRIAPGVGASALQVRFADVNGDARADYLVLDPSGPIRAWLNTPGDGGLPSWQSWGEIAPGTGASPHQINLTDINGDGRADYLVVETSGAVNAWLNTPGDGGLPSWQSWGEIAGVPGVLPGRIRFADLNGDRRADFLAVNTDGGVDAWLNTPGSGGRPSWHSWGEIARAPGVPGDRVRFANVDGDGRVDFLGFGIGDSADAWLNTPGDGGKPSWHSLGRILSVESTGAAGAVRFADLNGDGAGDHAVVRSDSSVEARLSTGTVSPSGVPLWNSRQVVATGVGVPGDMVRFADINGDGRDDYLVLKSNGAVNAWLNTPGDGGLPSWQSWGEIAPGTGAPGSQVRFADLDGDARTDYLVVADNGSVRAWRNTPGIAGKPSWHSWGVYAAGVDGATRDALAFADISGDGRADYLTVNESGVIRAWINNGGEGRGGWTNRGVFAVGVGASRDSLRLADINQDNKADYLVVSGNGSVRAWLNKGGDPV
ncbi:FG-GAP-like repeat-containing protein [Streptomyces albipurpureus]|uniref:FG-GAP-like repeat-containing protein n=1 Tax=Streptomyces albipurpureus TaxID=2897419 RepID=A0ABT0UF21_9ACTN|nr:FG-GAP-like repeat-containing protein [Streptomyces sp. CWNU-1]MCM2387199.1 FG-GAP-like repeat-containing protein [Streptomyces sp. CWNU-1]